MSLAMNCLARPLSASSLSAAPVSPYSGNTTMSAPASPAAARNSR